MGLWVGFCGELVVEQSKIIRLLLPPGKVGMLVTAACEVQMPPIWGVFAAIDVLSKMQPIANIN